MNSRMDEARLEELTQSIGRKLFRAARRYEPPVWKAAGAENLLMKLFMQDEDLRFRLLRFVDVYPSLKSSKAVAVHLEEYLNAPEMGLESGPGKLGRIARVVAKDRHLTRRLIHAAAGFGIARMGRQFIAGDGPEEVAPKVLAMERDGFLFTLDLLGEFVASEEQADHFARRYLGMIEYFSDLAVIERGTRSALAGPRVNLSIKLSSLTSKFDPIDIEGTSRTVRARLRPLLRAAKKRGAFINVDMEKYEYRDATLQIIVDLLDEPEFQGFPHFGTVSQAYLKDAEESLVGFLDALEQRGQPMTIRLVKGAYWDSEQIWARQRGWLVPVFMKKVETDAMYERCARILISGPENVRVALAGHNVRSIAHGLALRKCLGLGWERFEVQMLYGMAGPIKDALVSWNVPTRIYVPCGELIQGMAYLVRRILENTSNESFLRMRFAEGRPVHELLKNPKGLI